MIPLFKPYMSPNAIQMLVPVLSYRDDGSMYIGEGPKVLEFETAFQKLCDLPHLPLAVNSGTSALELALFVIGVRPGDEVIVTPITCSATIAAIRTHYAIPVWADVDEYGLIDSDDVQRKITDKTKAIIGVNWGGSMPNYKRLKSFGIPVVEDAAHGPYWTQLERGDYVAWSTQAIKYLTTGDGGLLFTPKNMYDDARLARWFGLDRLSSASFRCAQNIKVAGRKLHMNDIAATIGLANINSTAELVAAQTNVARYYDVVLKGMNKVHTLEYDPYSAYWIYTLLVDNPAKFMAYLKEYNIDSSPVHRRCDLHDAYHYPNGDLPGVEHFDNHQVSIPNGWWLTTDQVMYIADIVKGYDNV